ncbi:hypothetical protein HMPREF1556_00773 [Porphyromonas sp. oral taxon 278 str. W7784]|nr:hypothetical protein HMPREF1556_00773 [Porphyromonas sp. oral taxon 278 str. W7784]
MRAFAFELPVQAPRLSDPLEGGARGDAYRGSNNLHSRLT